MVSSALWARVVAGVKAGWVDGLCLLALAVACAVRLSTLEGALDLAPWDEADYLRRGLTLGAGGRLPDPEWGPLYSIWYFALSRIAESPVALFYLSYRALIVIPAFAVYACARRVGAPAGVALAGALLFVLSTAAHILPRPSLLAVALLLLAFAAAARARRFDTFALVLGLAALVASYARPEMFVSFAVASAAWAVALGVRAWRNPDARRMAAVQVGVWVGTFGLLVALLGNPMGNTSNRRMYAFCQHFALGEVTRSALPLNPWGECEAVLQRSFGDAATVGEAARANPTAFLTHLTDNLVSYPVVSVAMFARSFAYGRGIDVGPWSARRIVQVVLLASLLAWWVAAAWASRGGWTRERLRSSIVLRTGLLATAVLVPTVLSAVLIYPRGHYLVGQGIVVPLFVVALLVSVLRSKAPHASRGVTVASVGVALLSLTLSVTGALALPQSAPEGALANQRVVAALNDVRPASRRVRVLEAQGGYDAYAGPGFVRVSLADRRSGESFTAFLQRARVDVVVLEEQLLRHHLLRKDPLVEAFAASPEAFGYRSVALQVDDRRLAVREPQAPPGRRAPAVTSSSPRPN